MTKRIIIAIVICLFTYMFMAAEPLSDVLGDVGYSSITVSDDKSDLIVTCQLPDSSNEGSIQVGVVFAMSSAVLQYPEAKSVTVICLVENVAVVKFISAASSIKDLINENISGEQFVKKMSVALSESSANTSANYKKVLGEYFNAGSTWFTDGAAFLIKNGRYIIYPRDMDRYSYNQDISFQNGKIEVDTEWLGGLDNFGYGVIFRRVDNKHYYYLMLASVGYYVLGYIDGTEGGKLINWRQSPLITQHGSNHIEIITEGDNISVKINGKILCNVTDSRIKEGNCGVYVSKDVNAAFDNFEIYTK